MEYKYGEFSQEQMIDTKERLRRRIFFLLLYVDRDTAWEYEDIDVDKAFESILSYIGGLNKLLGEPPEVVSIMCNLEAARAEYARNHFNWYKYRKLVLDAGNLVMEIKEV